MQEGYAEGGYRKDCIAQQGGTARAHLVDEMRTLPGLYICVCVCVCIYGFMVISDSYGIVHQSNILLCCRIPVPSSCTHPLTRHVPCTLRAYVHLAWYPLASMKLR